MPTLTIHPTSTGASAAIVSSSGAANAWQDLSDGDDNTVTRGSADVAYVYLGLGDVTLSAGQRVKQVRTVLRYARDANDAGGYETAETRLVYNGLNSARDEFPSALPSPVVSKPGQWFIAAPGGGAWSQTVVNALQAEIIWSKNASGVYFLRVSDLSVEVETNSQPVVSGVAVSGATQSTTPTFSVSYSDADGDAQVRARFKVFSAAVYTAVGFNPDTSTAAWDSGVLNGAVTSGSVGAGLVSGGTYKLYAQAAQSWVGPLGSLWWSAWASSAAFTVQLVPPPTPNLTVVAVPDIPGYRTVATVDAPVNLLDVDSAGFEGSGVGTWVKVSTGANPTLARSTARSHTGVASMSLTSASTGTATGLSSSGVGVSVLNGRQYTARASFRAAATGRTVRVDIIWYAGSSQLSTSAGSTATDNSSGWVDASVTANAPATATSAVVSVNVLSTSISEVHYVDDISLHAGASTAWTPGGYRPTETALLERGEKVSPLRGTPENWMVPQLATGGTTLRATDGFTTKFATQDILRWEPLTVSLAGASGVIRWMQRSGSGAVGGGFNAGFTAGFGGDPATSVGLLYLGAHADPGQALDYVLPVSPGVSHTLSAWLWRGSSSVVVQLYIEWLDADGTTVLSTGAAGSNQTLTATPARYTATATAPGNAVWARGVVKNVNGSATTDVYYTKGGWGLSTVDDSPPMGTALTWTPVRALAGTAVPVGEQLVRGDYEIPPARPVVYRARTYATAPSDGSQVVSAASNLVPMWMAAPTRSVLADPFNPDAGLVANIDKGDTAGQAKVTTVIQPLGRDADPIMVTDWLSGLDGTLQITALDAQGFYRLEQILSSTTPLLVQFFEGGQLYMLVTNWEPTSLIAGTYRLSVAYLAAKRPA